MSKHRTTVFLESDMLQAIRKVAKDDERPMAYHYDKALRAYGPIKKLIAAKFLSEPGYTSVMDDISIGDVVVDSSGQRGVAIIASPVKKGFKKPSVNDLAIYFQELGSNTCNDDANSFFDHYESNGWKVGGKSAMKCWKAAARNWNKNKASFKPKVKPEGSFKEEHTNNNWRDGL